MNPEDDSITTTTTGEGSNPSSGSSQDEKDSLKDLVVCKQLIVKIELGISMIKPLIESAIKGLKGARDGILEDLRLEREADEALPMLEGSLAVVLGVVKDLREFRSECAKDLEAKAEEKNKLIATLENQLKVMNRLDMKQVWNEVQNDEALASKAAKVVLPRIISELSLTTFKC
jgi:hypothetical protein